MKFDRSDNKLVIVLGMHRSGTSAITRGLQVLGVSLGDRLMPPSEGNNDKGFWEDIDIVNLNVEMMTAINSGWHFLAPVQAVDTDLLVSRGYLLRAVELLRSKLKNTLGFGFKDPRTAKMILFWKAALQAGRFDSRFVLAIRNPLSVVSSLAKRDGFVPEKSYLLWVDHVVSSLLHARGEKLLVVDYDRLLNAPDRELERLGQFLGGAINPAELELYKSAFLDEGLRHTIYRPEDVQLDEAAPELVHEIYSVLLNVAADIVHLDDPAINQQVERWGRELNRLRSALRLADKNDEQIARCRVALAELEQQIPEFQSKQNLLCQQLDEHRDAVNYLNGVVAKRDSEIAENRSQQNQLCQQLDEHRDAVKYLNEVVAKRDSEIVEFRSQQNQLCQQLSEHRDAVRFLNEVIAERNLEIAALAQAGIDKDSTLASQEHLIAELRNETEAFRTSMSWRVTEPLRRAGSATRRLSRLVTLYRSHRQRHPGVAGLARLGRISYKVLRGGGLSGLRAHIANFSASVQTASVQQLPNAAASSILWLQARTPGTDKLPDDIAVHAHLFYPELASEIRAYLANIPSSFKLYITTDSSEKAAMLEQEFQQLPNTRAIDTRVVQNRGRDIAPMLVALGAELSRHEVVLHIHSKRSPHNLVLRGWRRYLMESLLGSPASVSSQLECFAKDRTLGILSAQTYLPVVPLRSIGGNAGHIRSILRRSGRSPTEYTHINQTEFPAGCMFWFRGDAIRPLVDMGLRIEDFEHEGGQCDATLAHAIERLFPFFASVSGLSYREFAHAGLHSPEAMGAQAISRLPATLASAGSLPAHIVFDHAIGGGTNRYGQTLFADIIAGGQSVVRVYSSQQQWLVEWISKDDGMIFVAAELNELFESLTQIQPMAVTVNSLYAHPMVDEIAAGIIELQRAGNLPLDYKVHDFYPLCPSQHLLDWNGAYCGVPKDLSVCDACLQRNPAAHWAHGGSADITSWRSTFQRLFDNASTITVFDPSSESILGRAYTFPEGRVRVVPHQPPPFKHKSRNSFHKPLHIGIFGTLTSAKGAAVVNSLVQEIEERHIKARITVVGRVVTPVHPKIRVLGVYEQENLPEIVSREGINLFFMASIIPETFSYTLSEAMELGLPIVTFDIGAQGLRVSNYPAGHALPLGASPTLILETMHAALASAKQGAASCLSLHQ